MEQPLRSGLLIRSLLSWPAAVASSPGQDSSRCPVMVKGQGEWESLGGCSFKLIPTERDRVLELVLLLCQTCLAGETENKTKKIPNPLGLSSGTVCVLTFYWKNPSAIHGCENQQMLQLKHKAGLPSKPQLLSFLIFKSIWCIFYFRNSSFQF